MKNILKKIKSAITTESNWATVGSIDRESLKRVRYEIRQITMEVM